MAHPMIEAAVRRSSLSRRARDNREAHEAAHLRELLEALPAMDAPPAGLDEEAVWAIATAAVEAGLRRVRVVNNEIVKRDDDGRPSMVKKVFADGHAELCRVRHDDAGRLIGISEKKKGKNES